MLNVFQMFFRNVFQGIDMYVYIWFCIRNSAISWTVEPIILKKYFKIGIHMALILMAEIG